MYNVEVYRLVESILIEEIYKRFKFSGAWINYNGMNSIGEYKYNRASLLVYSHKARNMSHIYIGCIPGFEERIKKYLAEVYGLTFIDYRCYEEWMNRVTLVYPYYMEFECEDVIDDIIGLFCIKGKYSKSFKDVGIG